MSIQLQQVAIKFFVKPECTVELDDFIPVFHAWIRDKRIDDQLLIDVADYKHVPEGPGVMLIAHEGHYGLDSGAGDVGLLYSRKRDELSDPEDAMRESLRRAARAALLLEGEELLNNTIAFRVDNIEFRVMSRLAAPNTAETRASLEPVWARLLADLGYEGAKFASSEDPRKVFALQMTGCTKSPSLESLAAL